MKDSITPGIEIVMPAVAFEKAVQSKHKTNVRAVKQVLDNEYNQWQETREYVRENMWKLKGEKTQLEVVSLTDIDTYNCVVINDMDMRTYDSIFEEIKAVEEKTEQIRINESLDAGLCPSGCGEVCFIVDVYSEISGVKINKCSACDTTWDYDNQAEKLRKLLTEIRSKGRLNGN